MFADMFIPLGQLILAEVKDGLHVIAENASWEPIGGVIDDCKLADRAVLTRRRPSGASAVTRSKPDFNAFLHPLSEERSV